MQPRFIMHKHLTSVSASMREPHVVSINRKWEYEKKHEREREPHVAAGLQACICSQIVLLLTDKLLQATMNFSAKQQ